MRFSLKYFIIFISIFIVEVLIATVFKNIFFVRAYLGDVLVVILIYVFLFSFFKIQNKAKLILGIFLFACAIEFAQYFHFAELFGLQNNKIAMIVLGNSFSWIDILCYAAGSIIIYLAEFYLPKVFQMTFP